MPVIWHDGGRSMPAACSLNKAIAAGVAVAEIGNAAVSFAMSRSTCTGLSITLWLALYLRPRLVGDLKSYTRRRLRRNRRQAIFRRATFRRSLHIALPR